MSTVPVSRHSGLRPHHATSHHDCQRRSPCSRNTNRLVKVFIYCHSDLEPGHDLHQGVGLRDTPSDPGQAVVEVMHLLPHGSGSRLRGREHHLHPARVSTPRCCVCFCFFFFCSVSFGFFFFFFFF